MTAPRILVLTVSDRSFRGERIDETGPALRKRAAELGWTVVEAAVLPDERSVLEAYLAEKADGGGADVILTAGGTGFAGRDVTPEATLAVVDREARGLAEAIRADSIRRTPHGMLGRGTAGIRRRTLIVNLSGSPRAAVEQLNVIAPALPHAVSLLREDPESEQGHATN